MNLPNINIFLSIKKNSRPAGGRPGSFLISLLFYGRRNRSVGGGIRRIGVGSLVGFLTGTTAGGHVVRFADQLVDAVDDLLVVSRAIDHSKSVDHFAHCEKMSIAEFSKKTSIQKTAFLVI